jgi:hypothetical protein
MSTWRPQEHGFRESCSQAALPRKFTRLFRFSPTQLTCHSEQASQTVSFVSPSCTTSLRREGD